MDDALLTRVVIYQGFKIYGVHLGTQVPTPARESGPPSHMPPNIYQAQEAMLANRAKSAEWDYITLPPSVIVSGNINGNPMNMAAVIGTFAAISRELGVPLRYPGSEAAHRVLMQTTDTALLGEASLWAAETGPRVSVVKISMSPMAIFSAGSAYGGISSLNFDLPSASPAPLYLEQHMADKQPVWEQIVEKHGLAERRLERVVQWGFGNFVFNTETDVILDDNKIYRHGFTRRCDSRESLFAAFDRLRERNILP